MKVLTRQERIANCVTLLTGKPDFPTFSEHVQAIMAAIERDGVSARELTSLIMRDYSLSLILLRRANAHNISGKPILNITHAVVMLGIEAVRHLAGSLLIFEHFHNKPAAVRELMMLSMLTANHVQQLARRVTEVHPQEAYLCGLVRNLGELLVSYYMPVEYARILKRAEDRKLPLSATCVEVLQFSFEELGSAVANYWSMPERVSECQRAVVPIRGPGRGANNLLLAAVSLGHEMTTSVYRMEPEAGAARLKTCLQDHYAVLPVGPQEVDAILANSIGETQKTFGAMGVHIDQLRLQTQTRAVLEAMAGNQDIGSEETPAVVTAEADVLELLSREVRTLVNSGSTLDLNALILQVLNAIYRGGGFDRVLFAFVNQERSHIEGRLGLGDGIDRLLDRFKFRLAASGGPVSATLLSRRTVNGNQSSTLARFLGCSYVGLYPVVVAGQVIGCIYMENHDPRPEPDIGQLRQLGQLRDSLVQAMRQVRAGPTAVHLER